MVDNDQLWAWTVWRSCFATCWLRWQNDREDECRDKCKSSERLLLRRNQDNFGPIPCHPESFSGRMLHCQTRSNPSHLVSLFFKKMSNNARPGCKMFWHRKDGSCQSLAMCQSNSGLERNENQMDFWRWRWLSRVFHVECRWCPLPILQTTHTTWFWLVFKEVQQGWPHMWNWCGNAPQQNRLDQWAIPGRTKQHQSFLKGPAVKNARWALCNWWWRHCNLTGWGLEWQRPLHSEWI